MFSLSNPCISLFFSLLFSLALFGKTGSERESVDGDAAEPVEETLKEKPAKRSEKESETEGTGDSEKKANNQKPVSVYVIPIKEQIDDPNLFILRRGLKEAIENDVDMILLDMDTPGGRVDITIKMMDMLAKFDGITATFVNDDAISAGSFIAAATQKIYLSPMGKIGASAVIAGGGQEVPETARLKIESYLRANIRVITAEYPYRSDVIRAMLDKDFELVIDNKTLKPKGELLTLTAKEAMKMYGDPPTPLLASGIYDSVEDLLDARFGAGNYVIKDFEVTYSERIAKWMSSFAPLLLGIGLLLLFIEFKTPGFGIFGIAGIAAVAVFFISQHIAGLAGNEVFLFFALGVALVVVELFLFPGTFVALISGVVLILGSLLWAMIDFWPGEPVRFSTDLIVQPLITLIYGISVAVLGILVFSRFFKGSFFERMLVLEESVASVNSKEVETPEIDIPEIGALGVAVTDLFPTGRIEIDGKRYEAKSALKQIHHGSEIRVCKSSRFGIEVEEVGE